MSQVAQSLSLSPRSSISQVGACPVSLTPSRARTTLDERVHLAATTPPSLHLCLGYPEYPGADSRNLDPGPQAAPEENLRASPPPWFSLARSPGPPSCRRSENKSSDPPRIHEPKVLATVSKRVGADLCRAPPLCASGHWVRGRRSSAPDCFAGEPHTQPVDQ